MACESVPIREGIINEAHKSVLHTAEEGRRRGRYWKCSALAERYGQHEMANVYHVPSPTVHVNTDAEENAFFHKYHVGIKRFFDFGVLVRDVDGRFCVVQCHGSFSFWNNDALPKSSFSKKI